MLRTLIYSTYRLGLFLPGAILSFVIGGQADSARSGFLNHLCFTRYSFSDELGTMPEAMLQVIPNLPTSRTGLGEGMGFDTSLALIGSMGVGAYFRRRSLILVSLLPGIILFVFFAVPR